MKRPASRVAAAGQPDRMPCFDTLLELRGMLREEVEARGKLADAMAPVLELGAVAQLVHALEVEVPAEEVWEGGHGTRSQHYAGVAFDVGQSLSQTQRTAIYNAARSTGAWGYVEPLSQTPTWVHFDRRYGTPACRGTTAGYPTLRRGSRGCYVMILQDALSTLGYQTGNRIDGIFGSRTEEALKGYQRRTSLRADGVCGCNSWKKISTAVLGVGRTKTTID